MRRAVWGALAVSCLALGCPSAGEPAGRRPRQAGEVDLAACLRVVEGTARPDSARCPGFLLDSLREGLATCRDAGGTLVPEEGASVWALDVDGDGSLELTFAHEGTVACQDAWSVFSCGSGGCPVAVYRQEGPGGAWRPIAVVDVPTPAAIEVLEAGAREGYLPLRAGCASEEPCDEYRHYAWTGDRYEITHLDVRGFRVDVSGSVHTLHALAGETAVLAEPVPGGRVLARYAAGTEVALLGTAQGTDYLYVSPCNACESGFVPRSALRVP